MTPLRNKDGDLARETSEKTCLEDYWPQEQSSELPVF